MKIGVLYCGYNQYNNIKNTLNFWNDIKIDGVTFIVCTVSVPFLEYKDMNVTEDGSIDFIKSITKNNIKNCIFEPRFVKERIARTLAMDFLIKHNIDILWQVDSDEYYTLENVTNIVNHLKSTNSFCYSVNFKNYIFDGNHYLDDFCPPKINRVTNEPVLSFFDDNQIIYQRYGIVRPDPIPREVAFVKHLTWLHENGKLKVEYQLKHLKECSYRWNDSENKLELNLDYYKKYNRKLPNIIKEI